MNQDTQEESPPRGLPAPAAFGSGLLMGGADAIPGVSGGTIALILGIYERFIDALGTVVKAPVYIKTPRGRAAVLRAFRLLVPLGLGVMISYYVATKLLVGKEEDVGLIQDPSTAPLCYGFFFGLVLFSLREPWRRIRTHDSGTIAAVLVGAVCAFVFSGLPYAREEPKTWMLLYGGALAISVMLLPGISGSLLLVVLNQYQTIVTAIHDRDLIPIGVFAVGLIAGLVTFVPILRRLLRTAHDTTMAVLTGLMAGSLRALWPWKTQYRPKDGEMLNIAPGDDLLWVVLMAAAAGVVVLGLGWLERRLAE